MKAGRAAGLLGPLMLLGGGVWFVLSLSTVRAGDLGLLGQGDPRVVGKTFPKVVIDPSGKQTVVPQAPERVVSLMLGADEIMTALIEPERIAGVSRFADSKEMSTCVDRVPDHAIRIRGADPERILALGPDLVFAAGYTLDSAVRILAGAGVPVVRFGSYRSYEDVADNVRIAGAVLGAEERAEALIVEMNRRLAEITERVAAERPPRVLYYSPIGYTTGRGTLVDEKIRRAGGRNVVAEAGLQGPKHLSIGLLVSLDPDVIVVPRWSAEFDPAEALRTDPMWADVSAVRKERVFALDARWLTSVSPDGVRGVEELARVLHPEVFST